MKKQVDDLIREIKSANIDKFPFSIKWNTERFDELQYWAFWNAFNLEEPLMYMGIKHFEDPKQKVEYKIIKCKNNASCDSYTK